MKMKNAVLLLLIVIEANVNALALDPCSFSFPPRCTNQPIGLPGELECIYEASWFLDETSDDVSFDISVLNDDNNRRWIGIGFSKDKLMPRTDVVIASISDDATQPDSFYLSDRFAFGYLEPIEDKRQDATLLAWSTVGGRSAVRFSRPRLSTDERDVNLTSSGNCPFFIFPHEPGSIDSSGNFLQHSQPPIAYGPICLSSCSAPNYVKRRGDCRRVVGVAAAVKAAEELFANLTQFVGADQFANLEPLFSSAGISFVECRQRCDAEEDCSALTYIADGSTCILMRRSCLVHDFDSDLVPVSAFHYEKMEIDGFWHSRSEACMGHHYEHAIDVRLATLRDCAEECLGNPGGCLGFSYQPSETRCFLHATPCSRQTYPVIFDGTGDDDRDDDEKAEPPPPLDTYAFIRLTSRCQPADVFLLLGLTRQSMTSTGLDAVADLVVDLLIKLDKQSVRLAVALWGAEEAPLWHIGFDTPPSSQMLGARLAALKHVILPEKYLPAAAMVQFAYSHAFAAARNSIRASLLFITSSSFDEADFDAAVYEASQARRRSVDIIGVGLGQNPIEQQLEAIVGEKGSVVIERNVEAISKLPCKLSNFYCRFRECSIRKRFDETTTEPITATTTTSTTTTTTATATTTTTEKQLSVDLKKTFPEDYSSEYGSEFGSEEEPVEPFMSFPSMDCAGGAASEGRLFYAAFLANAQPGASEDLELFVALSSTSSSSVIAAVDIDSHLFRDRLFVRGGQMGRILLPRIAFELPLSGQASVTRRGLRIAANASIAVLALNRIGRSSDGAIVLADTGLGLEHVTVAFSPTSHLTQLGVVAAHDDTVVEVTLPPVTPGRPSCSLAFGGRHYSNGESIRVHVDWLETLTIQAACDLSGTFVRSSRAVAVFSGNVASAVGPALPFGPPIDSIGRIQSHLVEQIPPVSRLGRLHAAVAAPRRLTGDAWAVVAAFDDTEISIYSNDRSTIEVASRLLNKAQKFEFSSVNDMHFLIAANKPILAVHFIKSSPTPPAMAVLPPIEQWPKRATVLAPFGYRQAAQNWLLLTVKRGEEDGLLVDGEAADLPTDASWRPVEGSRDLLAAFVPVSEGVHAIHHERFHDVRFSALLLSTSPNGSLFYSASICLTDLGYKEETPLALENVTTPTPTTSTTTAAERESNFRHSNKLELENPRPLPEHPLSTSTTESPGPIYLKRASRKPETTTAKSTSRGQMVTVWPTPPRRRKVKTTTPPTTPRPHPLVAFSSPTKSNLGLHKACFGDALKMECPGNRKEIAVVSAHFGRINFAAEVSCFSENPWACNGNLADDCGFADALFVLREVCDGKSSCEMLVDGSLLRRIPNNSTCDVCQMYLAYSFTCVSNYTRNSKGPRKGSTCSPVLAGSWGRGVTYRHGNYVFRRGAEVDFSYETVEAIMKVRKVPENCSVKADYQCKSSEDDDWRQMYFPPPLARLCSPEGASMQASGMTSWCPPLTCSAGCLPYIEIDLHAFHRVTGVVIQGRRRWDSWIAEFRIEHSFDAKAFNALARIFTGNTNAQDIIEWKFNSLSFTARYVRIVVTRYHGYPAGHIDLIRCKQYEPVGCRPITIPQSSVWREPLLRNRHLQARCDDQWMTKEGLTMFSIRCARNLYWHGVKACTRQRQCRDIPLVAGALHNATSTSVGAAVDYMCLVPNMHIRGNRTIVCRSDARWSPTPSCIKTTETF